MVVGRVREIHFDNQTFEAVVTMSIESRFEFPKDTSAKILTSGLLGEQFIGLAAGGDSVNLKDGDTLKITQSAVVLENLISQFLYSKAAEGGDKKDEQENNHDGFARDQEACAAALLAGLLSGCATTGGGIARDPLEPINRAMFGFNETFDDVLMKPVAKGYRAVFPEMVRAGVTNFFSNIEDVWIAANNLLQGKPENALQDVMRVAINTVIGLGGLIDVASDAGLDKHNEDFGQTFGRWGVGSGPYVVLPFFGPSTCATASPCSASTTKWTRSGTSTTSRRATRCFRYALSTAGRTPWTPCESWRVPRSTSTGSCATPICSGAAASSTTATRRANAEPDESILGAARRRAGGSRQARRRERNLLPQSDADASIVYPDVTGASPVAGTLPGNTMRHLSPLFLSLLLVVILFACRGAGDRPRRPGEEHHHGSHRHHQEGQGDPGGKSEEDRGRGRNTHPAAFQFRPHDADRGGGQLAPRDTRAAEGPHR